ncbi:hypothetical protein FLJC2902T_07070 [Flavobacterium limnosediminis JC2902]|uniref:Peptidase M56 domain-containing protein n=1 Tax=Flavobacterium limnosediminis JC2902 TaxID=1341181 RepID=V6SRQ2_9FLAO|nr:hypothetical protein [Flavobacterium limnosediminis]ESU29311.1 hypothetical protein FLJC2902T_07070 [Flavobacterium limnosediminis JC2902]
MILLVIKYLTPKGFRGITVYPFVFLKDKKDREDVVMLNHEEIHIRQQIEMLIVPFFLWYFIEYLIRWMQYKNRHTAYRNISFEREAYANEKDPGYLQQRFFWNFLKYV